MARNRKNNRSNEDNRSDMARTGRTDVPRQDRTMSAGASGDQSAGNEGIDDPAISRTSRDDLDIAGVDTRMTTGSETMDADNQGSSE